MIYLWFIKCIHSYVTSQNHIKHRLVFLFLKKEITKFYVLTFWRKNNLHNIPWPLNNYSDHYFVAFDYLYLRSYVQCSIKRTYKPDLPIEMPIEMRCIQISFEKNCQKRQWIFFTCNIKKVWDISFSRDISGAFNFIMLGI